MDVKAHKQQAQALEKKGQTAKAIASYREILDHLDGSKGLLRELPLFVKVGDLCFKEDDKKTALAMYDRAGQLYAEHGSGKSVIAVCSKILKVLPRATNTHVHYARLLVEGEHITEARKVLVNYAQLFDLPKVQRALEAMEGRSKSEMVPMLEMVLEMADLGMPEAESEDDDAPVEIAELDLVTGDYEVTVDPPIAVEAEAAHGDEPADTDVLDDRPVARQSLVTGDIASEIDDPVLSESDEEEKAASEIDEPVSSESSESDEEEKADSDGLIVKSGEDWEMEESSVVVEGGEKGPVIAAPEIPTADVPPPTAANLSDLPILDLGPPPDDKVRTMEGLVSLGDQSPDDLTVDRFSDDQASEGLAPSPSRPLASRPAPARPSRRAVTPPPRASATYGRPSAAHRPPGRRGPPKPKKRVSVFMLLVGAAFAVALGVALTKLFGAPGSSAADAPAVSPASRSNTTPARARPAPARPAPVQLADTTSIAIIPSDSILDSMDIDIGLDGIPSLAAIEHDSTLLLAGVDSAPASEPTRVPLISVEGLVVETIRALITPGRTGSRVVQILESGDRLTLTVFPLDQDAARDLVDGEVQVANITESIAQGIVRFGDYEVRARAAISSDSLEVLLQQLVHGPPTS